MLKALRKKEVAKRILYVLAAIIIPAFVLWGAGSLIRDRRTANYAGEIFGKKISLDQYRGSLLAVKNQAIIKFGENFFKLQSFLNLEKEAWDRLILLHEARKRKIKVSDKEVVLRIRSLPFLKTNEEFDQKLYQYLLDRVLQTRARDFEEEIRHALMFEKLFEQITNDITVTDEDVLEGYKKENEQIKIGYISFLAKDFEADLIIEEKELKDYFENNTVAFKKPPALNVQYIGLDYPEEPTEEDKQKAREKIEEIYSRLKEEEFPKVAKAYKLPVKETGFFGVGAPVPGFGLQYEIIQAAVSLENNQVSNPVETIKGIFILKLKERKPSYIPTFEEAKPSVEDILKNQKALQLAENKAKEYLAVLKENYENHPKSFKMKNSAESESLNYAQTPLFKYGEYISDIGTSKELSDEAFSLKGETKIFGFVSTSKGSYILKLEEFVTIDEKKFVQEKETFKEWLLQKKKDETFNIFFLELKTKARLVDNIPTMKTARQ